MAKGYGFRRARRAPRAKAPTAAQIAASEKAWAEADASFSGRAAKGEIVVDYSGQCFRVTRGGRRYHEDADTLLYPLAACRAPKEFATCARLRQLIEHVLQSGQVERGDTSVEGCEPPTAEADAAWQDRKANNYATLPRLEVRGNTLRAVRYVYDFGNIVRQLDDVKLAKEARKLIAAAPAHPVHLQQIHARLRGGAAAAKAIGDGLRAICASEAA